MKKQASFILPLITVAVLLIVGGRWAFPLLEESLEPLYRGYHKTAGPTKYAVETVGEEEVRNSYDPRPLIAEAKEVIREHPKEAWTKLEKAVSLNPHHPGLRIYRAKILEGAERPSLARKEFESARKKNPHDIHLVNEYAAFLLRQQDYGAAIELLQPFLESHREVAAKAFFLDRVIKPFAHTPPTNLQSPYLVYLYGLEPGTYWDSAAFAKLPKAKELTERDQTTFWLRLLQELKSGNEEGALALLENNPFRHESWNPELELHLGKILNFRKTRSFDAQHEEALSLRRKKIESEPGKMTAAMGDKELKSLWISPEVFAIALVSNGFTEAGISFHTLETYPESFPDWASFAFYDALKENRGETAASAFLRDQTPTAAIDRELGRIASP